MSYQRSHHRTYQPRDRGPADQHHDQKDAVEAGALGTRQVLRNAELGQVDRRQHDQQRQKRQRDHRICEAHQQGVGAAAEIARDDADQGAEDRGGDRADQADEQGHLAAVEQAQQDINANAHKVAESGGYSYMATLGAEFTVKRISFGGNFQTPLAQSLAGNQVKAKDRFMIHLSFSL